MNYEIKEIESIKKKLTRKNIESELEKKGYNAYDIAMYYIPGFKNFNIPIKSDLRIDDKNNSLLVRINNNKLEISDFGLVTGMTIYDYLIEKHWPNQPKAFLRALDMVRHDFHLDNIEELRNNRKQIVKEETPIKYNKNIIQNSLSVKIEVKRTKLNGKIHWSEKDIEYWSSYGITTNILESKGIAPLSKFWITNYNKSSFRTEYNVINELCYVYPFYRNKDGFFMYKIYMPKGLKGNPDFKWVSNVTKEVVQNIKNIPKSGDLLIIQSSYKDCLLIEILNPKLYVIAPNGEGMWFSDDMWQYLRANWKRIVYFANNDYLKKDNPGLKFARKYSEKYKIPFVSTPNGSASDISDYYKLYNKDKTMMFLDKTLQYINLIT